MYISYFLCANLQRYILNFVQAPAVFAGSGVGLHFRAYQNALPIFQKNHFWIHNISFL
jgi:hypothetical protein